MNNPTENKEKISARRTYVLLQQALFKLLTEMPFEKITLTELCSYSMVPRSTFYRYFEDKYDLLCYCLQEFFERANLDIDVIYLKDLDAMKNYLTTTIRVLENRHEDFIKIYQLNKDGIFMDILRSLLIQILTEKLKDYEKEGVRSKISYPIFTYLLADFYISTARCYLENSKNYTMDQFIENVCCFANKDFFFT